MPFAVTCRTCGTRFSVADELYQKRFAGRIVTLRCKRCQAPIRFDASQPPPPARKPAPPTAETVDRRPKYVPKPAPQPPRPPGARARVVALGPGLLDTPLHGDDDEETSLFRAPPRSPAPREPDDDAALEPPIDLTEFARSEPPSSDTPALGELVRNDQRPAEASEDVEFLLGLSGSPQTAAALASPPLPTFEEPPIDYEVDQAERPAPPRPPQSDSRAAPRDAARPRSSDASESSAPVARKRATALVVFLTLLGLAVAGVVVLKHPSPTPPPSAPVTAPVETQAEPARAEPEPVRAEPEPPSAEPPTQPTSSAEPAPAPAPEPEARGPRPPAPPSTPSPREPRAESTPASEATTPPASVAPEAKPPAAPPVAREPAPPPSDAPFDRAAAATALAASAEEASSCRQPGDPSGTASVVVTFAPSGRVTTATVSGPPFAGTKTGGCIAASLRRARVPPFAGDKVTVSKTVIIR